MIYIANFKLINLNFTFHETLFLRGRCFYIWPSQRKDDKKPDEVTFYTESASNNQIILELCQANHDLFMQVN